MIKVSGGGQSCVDRLVNRLQNFVVTGLNRLSVFKISNSVDDDERVEGRVVYIALSRRETSADWL